MLYFVAKGKYKRYMYFEYTEEEKRELDRIEAEYEQKKRELEAKIRELRPDDPEPPKEPVEALRAQIAALHAQQPDDYHSEEYKRLEAQIRACSDKISKIVDEWQAAGSEEWRKAKSELSRLTIDYKNDTAEHFFKAEERYVKSLGDDYERIYQDAIKQIYPLIEEIYSRYETRLLTDSLEFRARDVRLQDNGSFILDLEETRKNVLKILWRYVEALQGSEEYLNRFYTQLDTLLSLCSYVGNDGALWGRVKSESLKAGANKVKKYTKPITRVQRKIFDNAAILSDDDLDPWDVILDRKKTVSAAVAVDYSALVESGIFTTIPKLTGFDEDVYNALCSHWYAGNRRLSYDMIYRAMTGKVDGKVTISDDFYAQIDRALNKFRAPTVLEYSEEDDDGNTREFTADEPLVQFKRGKIKINGNVAARAIEVTSEPVLLSWGLFNHNEVSTRDITLLDVPRLNNGEESATIRRVLYARVDKMRHIFDKSGKKKELAANLRRIRYDYVYDALALVDPDANKRRLVKDKIDRILEYWTSKGFISGYEHVRDSSRLFYAVDVFFMAK